MNRLALLLLIFAGCPSSNVDDPTPAPVSIHALMKSVEDRVRANDDAGAIHALDKVLAAKPDHVAALAVRGTLQYKRGEYQKAIANLERAMVLEPNTS